MRRGGDTLATYTSATGQTSIFVADVSSKGRLGEGYAETLRWGFLTSVPRGAAPLDILGRLNRRLIRVAHAGADTVFAAAFVATFTPASSSLTYASAGHEAALLFRGNRHAHLSPTGPVLGIFPEERYEECTVPLKSRDVVVLATDGVTESRNALAHNLQFGTTGIARATNFAKLGGNCSVAEFILRECDAFCARQYRDDASVLVLGG